ncbi:MAG TPA: ABC transporter permease [Spirochaetia bacterium]|nr:ABC transporter permease [Spirochaetia bacterium]
MNLLGTVQTEFLKLKRTPITWVLGVVYCLAPLMLGLMMEVLKNPALARRLGLITAKAELTIGAVDWPTYLTFTSFFFAGGVFILAIAAAYVFGREYAEGTAKNLLCLPVHRATIVGAKLVVSTVWFAAIALVVYGEALLVGYAIGLPGFSNQLLFATTRVIAKTVLFVVLASTVNAWITVVSRGYLAPVGLSVLLFLVGDLFSHTGWGQWVPWSIILMNAQTAQAGVPALGNGSTIVMCAVFLAGFYATYLTLDRVDNTQ